MNRRELLKLILSGVIGHTLDVDRLLWVPGAKKIFIPSGKTLSMSAIVAMEMERILPKVRELFERDDMFYTEIYKKKTTLISSRPMRVPLIIGGEE